MNERQQRLYLAEWGKVRRALRAQGVPPKEADAQRHTIHVEALGKDKSSSAFTNADLDAVLKCLRARSQPANFRTQIDLENMPANRKRFGIRRLLAALGKDDSHVERLIESRREAGRIAGNAAASFDTLGEADLQRLMLDLKKECQKRWRRKGDLLTEVRLIRMENDFDEIETNRACAKALKAESVPDLNDLDYDNLLIVVATLRDLSRVGKASSDDPDWTV